MTERDDLIEQTYILPPVTKPLDPDKRLGRNIIVGEDADD